MQRDSDKDLVSHRDWLINLNLKGWLFDSVFVKHCRNSVDQATDKRLLFFFFVTKGENQKL